MHICVYIYMYVSLYTYVCMCVYMSIYIYVYVHIYIYIYIYRERDVYTHTARLHRNLRLRADDGPTAHLPCPRHTSRDYHIVCYTEYYDYCYCYE